MIVLGVTLLAFLSLSRYESRVSLQAMLRGQDPAAAAFGRITRDYPAYSDLFLLVSVEQSVPTRVAVDRLGQFARRLTEVIESSQDLRPLIQRVTYRHDDLKPFIEQHLVPAGLFYLDDEGFDQLMQRLTPDGMRQQIRHQEALMTVPGPAAGRIAQEVMKDPLRLHEFFEGHQLTPDHMNALSEGAHGLIVDPSGRSLLIRVTPTGRSSDLGFTQRLMPMIRGAVDQATPGLEGLRVDYAGGYAIAEVAHRTIRGDMIVSITVSVVMIQLMFWVMYRVIGTFLLALSCVTVGMVVGFGLYAWINPALTPPTAVIGAILAGLGVDYSVHLLSHYASRRVMTASPQAAWTDTLFALRPVVSMACLTTAIGFLAIYFMGVQSLRDLSLIAILGLIGILIASLMLLPALTCLSSRGDAGQTHASLVRFEGHSLIGFVDRYAKPLVVGSLGVVLGLTGWLGVAGGPGVETDLHAMHPQPNLPLTTQRRIVDRFGTSPHTLLVYLTAATEPRLVKMAHQVAQAVQSRPEAGEDPICVMGLHQFLPDPQHLEGRRRAIQVLDRQQILDDFDHAIASSIFNADAMAASRSFLNRLLLGEAPPTMALLSRHSLSVRALLPSVSPPARMDHTRDAVTVLTPGRAWEKSSQRGASIRSIRHALEGIEGATLTGVDVLSDDLSQSIQQSMRVLIFTAGTALMICLTAYFRRGVLVVLCVVPIVAAVVALLSYMRLADERFSLVSLISLPLIVGIGIDDGIFLVSLYRQQINDQSGKSMIRSLRWSTHAIIVTSVSTAAAFGTLAWTSVPAIQTLGRVMAVGVLAALFGTLFLLLPGLLLLANHGSSKTAPSA